MDVGLGHPKLPAAAGARREPSPRLLEHGGRTARATKTDGGFSIPLTLA